MTRFKHIVADCGGSSVTWAYCKANGSVVLASTPSAHPKYALDWTADQWQEWKRALPLVDGEHLTFYSAGCGNAENARRMQEKLLQLGFASVDVLPDSLGACRAVCGAQAGTVAILGTGSITLLYDGQAIDERLGGFGSLVGDEGGGFHFGKLLLHHLLTDSTALTDQQYRQLTQCLGTKQEIIGKLGQPFAQQWISGIAETVREIALENIHAANIRSFLAHYLPADVEERVLHVVGSYGFFQREILEQCCAETGWKTGKVLRDPLPFLVDFHR